MNLDSSRNLVLFIISVCTFIAGVKSKAQVPFHQQPRFLPVGKNFTFKAGQVAVLQCSIDNLLDRKVIWRRASDTTPLTVGFMSFSEDPRYGVEHKRGGTKWNLIIREVQTKDAGVYECQVSSTMRHLRHHVTLTVVEPPPPPPTTTPKPNIQISGSNYVDEGDRIYLVCNASSKDYPPEDIDWFRAGNTLTTDARRGLKIHKHVSISTGSIFSTLEIKHAHLSDQGVYVCRTSNRDVTSTQVNVLNGGTHNVKREKKAGADQPSSGQSSQTYSVTGHSTGNARGTGSRVPESGFFYVCLVALLTSLLTHRQSDILEIT